MPKHGDLSKDIESLLGDLDSLTREGTSVGNPKANTNALVTSVRKFACILTILSGQAEEQARRVMRLTWALFWLTFILLIIAAVQVAIMIAEHAAKAR